ncbi:MGMT family protein [Balneola sp. MJW-20]|uniref:MGMT family protein n=1 Tax=Gracilimonas aurantiaca TaxID=3234185 RepID=UPI0034678B75
MKQENSDLYDRIYEIVSRIPSGKVSTYGAIAAYIGLVSGARVVGYALNNLDLRNVSNSVPAHRVVNRLGQLTGRAHFPGDSMKERLEQENVMFTEEYTVDIQRHYWDPREELI